MSRVFRQVLKDPRKPMEATDRRVLLKQGHRPLVTLHSSLSAVALWMEAVAVVLAAIYSTFPILKVTSVRGFLAVALVRLWRIFSVCAVIGLARMRIFLLDRSCDPRNRMPRRHSDHYEAETKQEHTQPS